MLADIFSTYYRFVPGRQMNRACFFIQRKTLFGWSRVGTAWEYENASDEVEALNGVDPTLRDRKIPYIERTVGGPLLHRSDGYKHFLSACERIQWALGRTDAHRLNRKIRERHARQPLSEADRHSG